MPFSTEHRARQRDPKDFVEILGRTTPEGWPAGVEALIGRLPNGDTEIQTVIFDATKWTPSRAKAWLKRKGFKVGSFEPAKKTKKSESEKAFHPQKPKKKPEKAAHPVRCPPNRKPRKKFVIESDGEVLAELDNEHAAERLAEDLESLGDRGLDLDQIEGTIELSEQAATALCRSTTLAKAALISVPSFLPHVYSLDLPVAVKNVIAKATGSIWNLVSELGRVVQDPEPVNGGLSFVSKAASLRYYLNILAPEIEGCPLADPVNKAIESLCAFETIAIDRSLGLIKKRGLATDPEGGIHVHATERENKETKNDGAHPHLFLLTDGRMVVTNEDGQHAHELDQEEANWTQEEPDGEHLHSISIDDEELDTGAGVSTHRHELLTETTTFGGLHRHTLKIGDDELVSLLPGQFWDLIGRPDQEDNEPSNPATEILRDQVPETVKKFLGSKIRLCKSTSEDEQIVIGIVLEPNDGGEVSTDAEDGTAPFNPDTQNDVYSAEDIQSTCHKFNAEFQNIGLMHTSLINGDVQILESYIAQTDFEIGGQAVRKGSWIMALKVLSATLWADIKAGKLTGLSIGGDAFRSPLAAA